MTTVGSAHGLEQSVAHAEFVWRTVSEAIDTVPESDREAFLTRFVLLAALDHLDADELTALIAEARESR
ncbi:hypothetical protein DFQ14_102217 [Halopolyspora algeriensis]|uniref:Uncharacterized protein n=1 Tax=Halopolyspora algeriensis TaxID=1500506 RepID=A0A368VUZ3_9ACTN|nr:hypothetical protein [Halopolyspora algeriensis]RCW45916.1 hypothetical protein DFQ14_102217 [Halopolyspora algeriensis]TQM55329.1 hypothetical protein FHU43_0091 [Halopolyspora algeriensis]